MPAALDPILAPLSLLYRGALTFDRMRRTRSRVRLSRPTYSVGNLTVGGTGKTPLVIRLAADLASMGRRPAILTRGYRGVFGGAPGMSDEVLLMSEKLPGVPIGVGADRRESAERLLLNHSIDEFILDDGFQHWSLERNIDIVCVDATDPWGGGHLLPWGRLREPKTALGRAHVVVITRSDLANDSELLALRSDLKKENPRAAIIEASFKYALTPAKGMDSPIHGLAGRRAVALSGIGRPQAFEAAVMGSGAQSITALRFRDHHPYAEKDLLKAERLAHDNHAVVVTTEKDWVKLKQLRWGKPGGSPLSLFVLQADLIFKESDESTWRGLIQTWMKTR